MFTILTAESVTAGHPDKICDQISDALLDAYLTQDPHARVACECLVTTNRLIIAGEVNSVAHVDHIAVAREIIAQIGYDREELLFAASTCEITDLIHTQSPDIARGVDTGGAGDQGIMFGYATDETFDLLPTPIWYAHRLAERLHQVRIDGTIPFLRPDGKTQVSVAYENGQPKGVTAVVVSTQHDPEVDYQTLSEAVQTYVIAPVLGDFLTDQTVLHINPTGSFIIGGPHGDTGLTGRKIIVDTYGGIGRHGGGAFSGKDPTKVDRSGAYMARYLAKQIVARGRAQRAELQLSYAIGVAEPVSLFVETFGTETIPVEQIIAWIRDSFDLTPAGIIEKLQLRRPIYLPTATYGHFGRAHFPREEILQEDRR